MFDFAFVSIVCFSNWYVDVGVMYNIGVNFIEGDFWRCLKSSIIISLILAIVFLVQKYSLRPIYIGMFI